MSLRRHGRGWAERFALLTLALTGALALAGATPGRVAAETGEAGAAVLEVLLPVTAGQARELMALVRAHDVVVREARSAAGVLGEVLAEMPGAAAQDVLNAIPRHLALARGIAVDLGRLPRALAGQDVPLAGETLRALHGSSTLATLLGAARRLTGPEHRAIRLALVLTARAHGLPAADADLDTLRLALDRDAADLRPLVGRVLTRLVQRYGREALLVLVGS